MSASLMPRSDSYNARVRGTSHIDFKTATTGVAAKSMRNEISRLVATVEDPQTKKVRSVVHLDMLSYRRRLLTQRCNHSFICSQDILPSALKASLCMSLSSLVESLFLYLIYQ